MIVNWRNRLTYLMLTTAAGAMLSIPPALIPTQLANSVIALRATGLLPGYSWTRWPVVEQGVAC